MKAKVEELLVCVEDDMKEVFNKVVELEEEAAGRGYMLAIGLVLGLCQVYENATSKEDFTSSTMKQ